MSNLPLAKTLAALVPTLMLVSGSAYLFFRGRSTSALLQLVGAGCLMLVVLAHIAEALHLIPWMQWGMEHSVGHYLNLFSAIFGLTLFPMGYVLHAFAKRRANRS